MIMTSVQEYVFVLKVNGGEFIVVMPVGSEVTV